MFKSDSCEVQLTGVDMCNFRLFAVYSNCVTYLLEPAENYRQHVCAVYCLLLVKTCRYRRIFVLFHNDLNRFFVMLVIYLILVLTSEL